MSGRVSKILRKAAAKLFLDYRWLKKGYNALPWPKRHLHLVNLRRALDKK